MIGVSISGASNIYGGNMSVIHNSQKPEYFEKEVQCHVSPYII